MDNVEKIKMMKIIDIKNRREFYKISGMFLLGLAVYGTIIAFFTSTVYVTADEELYVALAKSFHYTGSFEVNGKMANYNCVLYSILISLAYYFYSPESILFFMRFIGVICMCSAIFPIWLLARRMLKNEKEIVFISGLSMLMPYMFDCAYLIQEVLSYPLFLWTIYFLFLAYEQLIIPKGYKPFILGAVFSVFSFFTKTYLFFIPVVFNICLFLEAWKKKRAKEIVRGLCLYDGIYLAMAGVLYILINAMNGFETGSNHYAGQFSWLFPVTKWTVISGVVCIAVYTALLIINMGIIPPLSILCSMKKYEETIRWLAAFILTSCMFLVIEIVVLIVLTEEGVPTVPHKFLFRYFQVLVPPVLILFTKIRGETDFRKQRVFTAISAVSLSVTGIYFIYMNGNTRQSIADGYFYLLLENITKNILPYGDVIIILMIACLLTIIIVTSGKKNKSVLKPFCVIGIAGILSLWLLNCIQLPFYTNSVAGGKQIQEDSIKIARYLNENEYDYIYYVVSSMEENDSYVRNFYGYMKQPHQVIYPDEIEGVIKEGEKRKAVFLVSTDTTGEVLKSSGMMDIGLELNKLQIYV